MERKSALVTRQQPAFRVYPGGASTFLNGKAPTLSVLGSVHFLFFIILYIFILLG